MFKKSTISFLMFVAGLLLMSSDSSKMLTFMMVHFFGAGLMVTGGILGGLEND